MQRIFLLAAGACIGVLAALAAPHVAPKARSLLAHAPGLSWLLPVGLAYWALIMAGSVLLGWHYAADGYAATLIAIVVWRLAGLYGRRSAADSSPVEA